MKSRNYRVSWENDPELAPWIAKSRISGNVYCKFCKNDIVALKPNLKRHFLSKTHQRNALITAEVNLMTNTVSETVRENDNNSKDVSLPINAHELDHSYCKKGKSLNNDQQGQSTKRKYLQEWNVDEDYSKYIKPGDNMNEVLCSVCHVKLLSRKFNIDRHLESEQHLFNAGKITSTSKFDGEAAVAEIRLAATAVDNDISFLGMENIVGSVQQIFQDSNILQRVSLDRKKCSAIIRNILAPAQKERLTNILKGNQFSILIDECTDISVHSAICINIRYADVECNKVCDTLWDVVPAYEGDEDCKADAEFVFNQVINTFKEAEIPPQNIISFCSDTCNLMMGHCNSVATRFKALVPNIKIIKCACHLEHLVARDAVNILPSECINLLSLIYNYISGSSKRMHNWFVLQKSLDLNPLIILRHTVVRWLSLYECILRILRRYTALITFFENECNDVNNRKQSNANDKSVETILKLLEDPLMRSYLLFLEAMLSRLTRVNEFLQTSKAIIPTKNNKMTEVYIEFLKMYMNDDYVSRTEIADIDPDNYKEFKELNDIYIGENTRNYINSIVEGTEIYNQVSEFVQDFRVSCRKFQIEVCTQIKERCDLQENRHFFHPKNALSNTFHEKNINLDSSFEDYKHFKASTNENLKNTVNDEWSNIVKHKFPEQTDEQLKLAKYADDFWFIIKNYCENGKRIFENLADFALTVLSIPHSNATPERVWSKQKRVKTKTRNRLSFPMLRSVLLSSQYVKDKGGAETFIPTNEMVEKMKNLQKRTKKILNAGKDNSKTIFGNIELSSNMKQRCCVEELMFRKKYSDMDEKNKANNFLPDFANLIEIDSPSEINALDNFCNIPYECLQNNTDSIDQVRDEDRHVVDTHNLINDSLILHKKMKSNSSLNLNDNSVDSVNQPNTEMTIFETDCCMDIMANGLMSNISYYMRSSRQFTIGRYRSIDNHPIRDYRQFDENGQVPQLYASDHEFQLWSTEYQTLNDTNFIDGDVIDAFGCIREKRWIDTIAVPTQQTSNLLVNFQEMAIPSNWFMFHLRTVVSGKILMPYTVNQHWCLFVVDIDNRSVTHIDPLMTEDNEIHSRSISCHKNFIRFLQSPNQRGWNSLREIDWTYNTCQAIRPLQTDGHSCGVFIMHYMDCIGRNIDFNWELDPMASRNEFAELLINQSESMVAVCLYCYDRSDEARNAERVQCALCNRFAHRRCYRRHSNQNSSALLYICELCSNSA